MSAEDAFFLYFEKTHAPLHITTVAIFASTFLSWPIAVVLTLVILLGHWGVAQLGDATAPGRPPGDPRTARPPFRARPPVGPPAAAPGRELADPNQPTDE